MRIASHDRRFSHRTPYGRKSLRYPVGTTGPNRLYPEPARDVAYAFLHYLRVWKSVGLPRATEGAIRNGCLPQPGAKFNDFAWAGAECAILAGWNRPVDLSSVSCEQSVTAACPAKL